MSTAQQVARHLGVVPAIAVGLVKRWQRRHYFRITYHDESKTQQVAIFEVSKGDAPALGLRSRKGGHRKVAGRRLMESVAFFQIKYANRIRTLRPGRSSEPFVNGSCRDVNGSLAASIEDSLLSSSPEAARQLRGALSYLDCSHAKRTLLPPRLLALVGMSGAGKTFWTKKLASEGWTAISCDDRIEEKL